MIKIGNNDETYMFSKTGKFTSEIHNILFKPISKERKTVKPHDFFEYVSNINEEENKIKEKNNKNNVKINNNKKCYKNKINIKKKESYCFLTKERDLVKKIKNNKVINPPLGLYNPKPVDPYKGTIIYKKSHKKRKLDNKNNNNNSKENLCYSLNSSYYNTNKIKGFINLDKQLERKNFKFTNSNKNYYNLFDEKRNIKNYVTFKHQLGHFYKEKFNNNMINNYNPKYDFNKKNLSIGIPNMKKYSKRNYLKKELKNKNAIYYNDLVKKINLVEKKNYKLIEMDKMKKTIKNNKFPIFMQKNINNRNNLNTLNEKMLETNHFQKGNYHLKLNSNNEKKNYNFDNQLDFLNY